jgi:glycosyltransferase involved in cell wall biosynthesis
MSMAWVVVVPSVWNEPAGLVPLDAAAHGRFVVASDAGGLPEYVAPDASALVPPNDTDALAATLTRVLGNYDMIAAAGQQAQHHARVTFSATHTAWAYEQLYEQVIASRPASHVPLAPHP